MKTCELPIGLSSQSWECVKCKDGKHILVKIFFDAVKISYTVLCYDGKFMYNEDIQKEDFLQKCKVVNPYIEATPEKLLDYLQKSFESCKDASQFETLIMESGYNLSFKSKIHAHIMFSWTFQLQQCCNTLIKKELVEPLFAMVSELERRQLLLTNLLERKDREIEDYKLQGYTTSKKYLETAAFDMVEFTDTCNLNKEFLTLDPTQLDKTVNALPSGSELFRNIMRNKTCAETTPNDSTKVLREPVIDHVTMTSSTVEVETNLRSPVIENVDVAPALEKDDEEERRRDLKKRLSDEAERKNKKKKRKIKI